jgi:endonuclease III
MNKLLNKKQIDEVIKILDISYPNANCSLNYENPLQLTIALILAAQCTDNMVNKIVPILFDKYPTVEDLASVDITKLKNIIKPCGFYITKAKNIKLTCNKLVNDFNGIIPNNMKDLTSLYGIGRKSSNIILQECYNIVEGIAVDTHVSRVSYRLGITNSNIPLKQEIELINKVDKKYWHKINHILVYHGRAICDSRKPKCDICMVNEICKKRIKKST